MECVRYLAPTHTHRFAHWHPSFCKGPNQLAQLQQNKPLLCSLLSKMFRYLIVDDLSLTLPTENCHLFLSSSSSSSSPHSCDRHGDERDCLRWFSHRACPLRSESTCLVSDSLDSIEPRGIRIHLTSSQTRMENTIRLTTYIYIILVLLSYVPLPNIHVP